MEDILESQVKKPCYEHLEELENQGKLVFVRNNTFKGVVVRPGGSRGYLNTGRTGSPDCFVFCQDKRSGEPVTLHIEYKRPVGGKLSPDQIKWRDVVVQWGHDWYEIRDVEELKLVLSKYV